jgi:hypothetical protein
MPVFSPAYNSGLLAGVAAGTAISLWWYARPSLFERVQKDVQASKGSSKH